MDPVEARMLQAIVDEPDEDAPRLVYADWLLERGDPRGELITVQCQRARLPSEDPGQRALLARENSLWLTHGNTWTSAFRTALRRPVRGFFPPYVTSDETLRDEVLRLALATAVYRPSSRPPQFATVHLPDGRVRQAVMKLDTSLPPNDEVGRRLTEEFSWFKRLRHQTGLARALVVGATSLGDPVFLYEVGDATPLSHLLEDTAGYDPDENVPFAAAIGVQVAEILNTLEPEPGLVATPDTNTLFLRPSGQVLLTRLGPPPAASPSDSMPPELVRQLSPEALRGSDLGPAHDVFVLGSVMFEAILGAHPSIRSGFPSAGAWPLGAGPDDTRLLALPEGFADILRRCLSPASELRPTAGSLRRELQSFLAESGFSPEEPIRQRLELPNRYDGITAGEAVTPDLDDYDLSDDLPLAPDDRVQVVFVSRDEEPSTTELEFLRTQIQDLGELPVSALKELVQGLRFPVGFFTRQEAMALVAGASELGGRLEIEL